MQDKRNNLFDRVVKAVLFVGSRGYGCAVNLVDMAYRVGLRKIHKAKLPVISVGNITLGGTGKTPFAMFLADHFSHGKKKASILIRGYGKDESVQLKEELADVPVYVGQDRVKNAALSASEGNEFIILDDGFQHRRLGRDLDIVLIDSEHPFGNGQLVPRGVLREPVSSLIRAGIVVATKIDKLTPGEEIELEELVKSIAPKAVFITARHRPLFFTDVTGAAYSVEDVRGKKVCMVSGIGDPEYFRTVLDAADPVITEEMIYPDHHNFRQVDVGKILAACTKSRSEYIVTTKKDYVKLKELDISLIEEKIMVLNIAMDVVKGKEKLIAGLNSVIFC